MFSYEDVIEYCISQYGAEPDHPWARYPDYTVLRHPTSRKWYALVMNVPGTKVGLESKDVIWVLNVKCDPVIVRGLQHQKGFAPAYHMNKETWISVLLDGTVLEENIKLLIDESYQLTK